MKQAHFVLGPLHGEIRMISERAERLVITTPLEVTYVPAPYAIEWRVGPDARRPPWQVYSVQPCLWVPEGMPPSRFADWCYDYASLFIYADLLVRSFQSIPR